MSKQPHGGKRPGAGRPLGHGEPTTSVQVRVPKSLLATIDEAAAGREVSRNQIIIEALQASQDNNATDCISLPPKQEQ